MTHTRDTPALLNPQTATNPDRSPPAAPGSTCKQLTTWLDDQAGSNRLHVDTGPQAGDPGTRGRPPPNEPTTSTCKPART